MNTPKPVVNAIFPDEVKVGSHRVYPLSLANTLLLEKVGSPFFLTSEEKAKLDAREPDVMDAVRALYILTRTTAQLRSLYTGFSLERFEAEVWEFGNALPPGEAAALMPAFNAVLSGATSTQIGGDADATEPPTEEDGKKKNLSQANFSAPAKATDSASH